MAIITLAKQEPSLGTKPRERSVEQLLQTGFIAIDKPVGPSSHEVSAYASRILGLKKAGHTGTLDPNVSGVLVILLESSCKIASYLPDTDKEYACVMETNMQHAKAELEAAFENFRGKIYQTPPMASAVARRLRIREIYSLEILDEDERRVLFSCKCEAGTYMRKLCTDAGRVLGDGAEMVELRRTMAMGLHEKDSVNLQKLSDYWWLYKEKGDDSEIRKIIRPIEELCGLKKAVLLDGAVSRVLRGMDTRANDLAQIDSQIKAGELVALCTGKGELVAIAKAMVDASKAENAEGTKAVLDVERLIRTSI